MKDRTGRDSVGRNGGGQRVASEGASPRAATPQRDYKRGRLGPLLLSGLVGAVTVTLLNEGVRRMLPHAPRMDVIGERALARSLEAAHLDAPHGRALYIWTVAADLVSNALYYSLVGAGTPPGAWRRGSALGLAAGLGAVTLPRPLGLGRQPGARAPRTPLLTVTWYLAGGLAAAATYRSVADASENDRHSQVL